MKINVIVNGKIGVMNLTHSTFIVEDLKAHICNKIGLDVDNYKLKIDFNGDSIELVQTKSNPSFSSNQTNDNHVDAGHDRFGQPYREYTNRERIIHKALKEHLNHPLDVFHISPNKQSIEIFFKNTRGTKPLYIKDIAKRIFEKHNGYNEHDVENICNVLVNSGAN